MSQANPDDTGAFRVKPETFAASLQELAAEFRAANKLFGGLAARINRLTLWHAAAGVVFCIVSGLLLGHACVMASRLSDVTAQLDSTVQLLEQVRTEQDQTQRRVADVGQQVAEARAEAPTVEIRTSDAGVNSKPQAVVVVRPAAPRKVLPAMPPAGSAPPQPPAIVLPLNLPPGSKTIAEDAGAP